MLSSLEDYFLALLITQAIFLSIALVFNVSAEDEDIESTKFKKVRGENIPLRNSTFIMWDGKEYRVKKTPEGYIGFVKKGNSWKELSRKVAKALVRTPQQTYGEKRQEFSL